MTWQSNFITFPMFWRIVKFLALKSGLLVKSRFEFDSNAKQAYCTKPSLKPYVVKLALPLFFDRVVILEYVEV